MAWSQLFVLQELDSQIDALRDALHLSRTLSDGRNQHLDERSASARRESAANEERLADREADRAKAAAGLPEPLLGLYEKLRGRHQLRPWVVWLTGSHCPACNLALPSAALSEARTTRQPAPCPSCHRLLIWREAPPPPGSPTKPGADGR